MKLAGNLEFGVKASTERATTYTEKQETLNELHEFMRTHEMVGDRMKARYDRAGNMKKDCLPSYKLAWKVLIK